MFQRLGAFFLDILQVVVFAVAIFLFVYLLIMRPHKIKGLSMFPTYDNGEYLLTLSDKLVRQFDKFNRGDVVIFEAPTGNGEEFIKRIIGLPGDTISIKNNTVIVNNTPLREDYLEAGETTDGSFFLKENDEKEIPQGKYFVMGDNRNQSSDSRSWGFVDERKITGRAWFVYYPFKKAGKVSVATY